MYIFPSLRSDLGRSDLERSNLWKSDLGRSDLGKSDVGRSDHPIIRPRQKSLKRPNLRMSEASGGQTSGGLTDAQFLAEVFWEMVPISGH